MKNGSLSTSQSETQSSKSMRLPQRKQNQAQWEHNVSERIVNGLRNSIALWSLTIKRESTLWTLHAKKSLITKWRNLMPRKERRKPRKRRRRGDRGTVAKHSTTSLCLKVTIEEKTEKMMRMTTISSRLSSVDFQSQERVHRGKNLQIQKVIWLIFVRKLKQKDISAKKLVRLTNKSLTELNHLQVQCLVGISDLRRLANLSKPKQTRLSLLNLKLIA